MLTKLGVGLLALATAGVPAGAVRIAPAVYTCRQSVTTNVEGAKVTRSDEQYMLIENSGKYREFAVLDAASGKFSPPPVSAVGVSRLCLRIQNNGAAWQRAGKINVYLTKLNTGSGRLKAARFIVKGACGGLGTQFGSIAKGGELYLLGTRIWNPKPGTVTTWKFAIGATAGKYLAGQLHNPKGDVRLLLTPADTKVAAEITGPAGYPKYHYPAPMITVIAIPPPPNPLCPAPTPR
jgi:hypothetical protein